MMGTDSRSLGQSARILDCAGDLMHSDFARTHLHMAGATVETGGTPARATDLDRTFGSGAVSADPAVGAGLRPTRAGHVSYLIVLSLPLAVFIAFRSLDPFAGALSAKTVSLSQLTPRQKANIHAVARALDGVVLIPGREFSFNGTVGPRTVERGYRLARSYLGPDSPMTPGGGICLVSSALYQAALESGLTVVERVAHTRPVRSVPPGLDATVWYGQADLRLRNDLDCPVRLGAGSDGLALTIKVTGRRAGRRPVKLSWRETQRTADAVAVEVTADSGSSRRLVSRDLYRLTTRP